jgi:hypothetical protein
MLVTILSFLGIQSLRTVLIKVAIYGGIGLASWILVWLAGYNSAKEHYLDQARLNQARLERQIDDFRNKFETELEQKEILQEALAQELAKDDEKAVEDPGSTTECIGTDGVRRLNQGFGHR